VIENPAFAPELKAAAHVLLEQGVFGELDDAGHTRGVNDAFVGRVDVEAWLRDHPPAPVVEEETPPATEQDGVDDDFQLDDEHECEIEDILGDPSMTIEDQVAAILMLIMKMMDRQIENQLRRIDSLQKAQSKDGKDTSIDTETLKLKRMIDKRSQMFDMLRQIIDKYNQTAKGIIDTIGR
jgi:hypothetical protein